MPSPKLW